MDKRKKRPGGAEKLRLKKLKSLEVEAAKYSKLTDLFGAGVTTPAGAAAPGDERTRWWAKHEALKKVFGSFGKPEDGLYVDVLLTLSAIQKQATVKPCIRVMARGYAESFLKYETILTAQIFLRIFEHTSPLSKYLQTAGLDILSAHRMVASTQDTLKSLGRDFESVKKAADTFVNWTNTEIQERDDTDIEVEATLPQKRRRMKKVLPGEMAQDETLDDAEKSYEVNVHNRIMDTAIEAIHRRFLTHDNLYADLACLDPRNFPQLCTSALPQSALQDLSKCLQGFDSRATKENMQAELKSFALQWNRLKASPLAEYKARAVEDGSEKDILMALDSDSVIDRLAEKSELLKKLLH
ncbi:hypothetical protein JOQ06_004375 [Pogonophryne albipinna]|uniref:Uncharacterized protein n=1 Tax=Pogonophryne albipinna TaxID=1090488 RepID=A0AAD6APZ4_9TELE|nr:hypothetical protein JOQ06_004375 [Pogonophryne albipinna]